MEKPNFEELFNWHFASYLINGNRNPDTELNKILDAVRMAPTNRGLQTFKVITIDSLEIKGKTIGTTNNQP